MARTKRWYSDQILFELRNDKLTADFKIDEREVFVRLDAEVNAMARQSYFDNWQVSGPSVDEQFITTWEPADITVVDQSNGLPSYFELPASYIDLPNNAGIDAIWPKNYNDKFGYVVVMSYSRYLLYRNNKAGNMQGRLYGYPKGNRFYFGTSDVKKNYGGVGCRLVIRDSSMIDKDAVYPVPADKERAIVARLVEWFRNRIMQGSDTIRDNQDKVTVP